MLAAVGATITAVFLPYLGFPSVLEFSVIIMLQAMTLRYSLLTACKGVVNAEVVACHPLES